jgi:hypothetical protein
LYCIYGVLALNNTGLVIFLRSYLLLMSFQIKIPHLKGCFVPWHWTSKDKLRYKLYKVWFMYTSYTIKGIFQQKLIRMLNISINAIFKGMCIVYGFLKCGIAPSIAYRNISPRYTSGSVIPYTSWASGSTPDLYYSSWVFMLYQIYYCTWNIRYPFRHRQIYH